MIVQKSSSAKMLKDGKPSYFILLLQSKKKKSLLLATNRDFGNGAGQHSSSLARKAMNSN
ncbi:hypothetical protein DN068_16025 [Taibaiella soli]|uniref:Uncharacterized protein n=1 Tax=Taibaiella soli TaxID=1649169 RepID=A0A2W2A8I6_9BACT|nr:hypothetical protein DN068_16025 [Taibaiella soli]